MHSAFYDGPRWTRIKTDVEYIGYKDGYKLDISAKLHNKIKKQVVVTVTVPHYLAKVPLWYEFDLPANYPYEAPIVHIEFSNSSNVPPSPLPHPLP